jgi:hypothetical protein
MKAVFPFFRALSMSPRSAAARDACEKQTAINPKQTFAHTATMMEKTM